MKSHDRKPPDTRWLKPDASPDGREGNYRDNGNRVRGDLVRPSVDLARRWRRAVPRQLRLPLDCMPDRQGHAAAGGAQGRDRRRVGLQSCSHQVADDLPARKGQRQPLLPAGSDDSRSGWRKARPTPEHVRIGGRLRRAFKQGLPPLRRSRRIRPSAGARQATSPIVIATPRPVITSGPPIMHAGQKSRRRTLRAMTAVRTRASGLQRRDSVLRGGRRRVTGGQASDQSRGPRMRCPCPGRGLAGDNSTRSAIQ